MKLVRMGSGPRRTHYIRMLWVWCVFLIVLFTLDMGVFALSRNSDTVFELLKSLLLKYEEETRRHREIHFLALGAPGC